MAPIFAYTDEEINTFYETLEENIAAPKRMCYCVCMYVYNYVGVYIIHVCSKYVCISMNPFDNFHYLHLACVFWNIHYKSRWSHLFGDSPEAKYPTHGVNV